MSTATMPIIYVALPIHFIFLSYDCSSWIVYFSLCLTVSWCFLFSALLCHCIHSEYVCVWKFMWQAVVFDSVDIQYMVSALMLSIWSLHYNRNNLFISSSRDFSSFFRSLSLFSPAFFFLFIRRLNLKWFCM